MESNYFYIDLDQDQNISYPDQKQLFITAQNSSGPLEGRDIEILKFFFRIFSVSRNYRKNSESELSLNYEVRSPLLLKIFLLQVNLFQKHLFLHQLTQNMTRDCSWNYPCGLGSRIQDMEDDLIY